MNKNSKWLLAILCACVAMGTASACGGAGDGSTGGQPTKVELTLSQESVQLELFEEYDLQYAYNGEEALVWSVEDSSVVTVQNGKLVALKEGTTTVSVQGGELSDTCTVQVKGVDPSLLKVAVAKAQIGLYVGDSYSLMPTVTYGTKDLTTGLILKAL